MNSVGVRAHDFSGRTALITGAGRGIGRAYALLLAQRGATVVVNDLGSTIKGEGSDDSQATGVVAEIVAAGGTAIADDNDVADVEGAKAMVDTALDCYDRIDVVINNAGIMAWADPGKVDAEAMKHHLEVHVGGSFNTAKAAWPHMVEQSYGRIVMTVSTGIFGLPNNLAYATAKGGVLGMTRGMAAAGAADGIKVNAIAPAAFTRMAGPGGSDNDPEHPMAPELVAPMAAYLAHEDCPTSGEVYTAGARRFARLFIGSTQGWLADGTKTPSIEDVADHWATITTETGYFVPIDLPDWSRMFLAHLDRPDSQ